jgi:hypothetical protein
MGWQIVGEPEQHGDDWSVVFRMDGLERDAAGPRIVVTATAWSQAEEIEVLNDGDEPEIAVCGVSTYVDYEVLGPDGRAIARYQEPNPAMVVLESDSATVDSARECAEETVSEFAEEPDQWRWDGSAEALTAGTRLRLRAWRVASETEEDGDDWVVVFRMDNQEPDSEGPQIVVTGSPMSSGGEEDDDEDEDEDDDEGEKFVSFGNSTHFEYQIWGPDGNLVARLWREDPNEYHGGWESESFEEASDRALSVVEEFEANPGYWKWDGTAESKGLEPVRTEASQ